MQNLQWWRMEQQKGNRGAKHKHRLNSNLDIERALIKAGGKSGCNKHSTDNDGRTLHPASLINTTFLGQQADKASSKTSHQPARQRQLEVKANLVVLRTWRGIWDMEEVENELEGQHTTRQPALQGSGGSPSQPQFCCQRRQLWILREADWDANLCTCIVFLVMAMGLSQEPQSAVT